MPPAHRSCSVLVLVVEDDPPTRELFRSTLRHQGGYAVVAVEDGLDALNYLDTHAAPAAVALDWGLPRLHGRDVLGEMAARGLTERIPVIVVTGQTSADLNERDFACVLHKPISTDDLLASVRRCLGEV